MWSNYFMRASNFTVISKFYRRDYIKSVKCLTKRNWPRYYGNYFIELTNCIIINLRIRVDFPPILQSECLLRIIVILETLNA